MDIDGFQDAGLKLSKDFALLALNGDDFGLKTGQENHMFLVLK